jgi:hypothetical protein
MAGLASVRARAAGLVVEEGGEGSVVEDGGGQ